MSYSAENRTLAQLKSDLDWYQQKRLRISGDYLKMKQAIAERARHSDPKSDLATLVTQFYAVLEESHRNIEERLEQHSNSVHIEIARRIQQHDPAAA